MKNLLLMLFISSLCISCSSTNYMHQLKFAAYNPLHIELKSKKAFTVQSEKGGLISFYSIVAKNVPPDRKFYLYTTDTPDPNFPPLEVVSDSSGKLRLGTDRNVYLKDYLLSMPYRLPGERSSVWLLTDTGNSVNTTFIAYPLEALGSDGAEISIIRKMLNGTLVICKGKYFHENEKLTIISKGADKPIETPVTARNGAFSIDLTPPDSNSYGGTATVLVKRQNGEVLSLQYPWGRESFNKDLLQGNYAKFTDKDYEKIEEAHENYFKKSSSDALI
ncbi:MAG: hypothetical protein LLF94_09235 [Chlamydiales bacterium]|nr:hypothetical protein [Chlamydiales bacterium]